jgi:hypothetical protein
MRRETRRLDGPHRSLPLGSRFEGLRGKQPAPDAIKETSLRRSLAKSYQQVRRKLDDVAKNNGLDNGGDVVRILSGRRKGGPICVPIP